MPIKKKNLKMLFRNTFTYLHERVLTEHTWLSALPVNNVWSQHCVVMVFDLNKVSELYATAHLPRPLCLIDTP